MSFVVDMDRNGERKYDYRDEIETRLSEKLTRSNFSVAASSVVQPGVGAGKGPRGGLAIMVDTARNIDIQIRRVGRSVNVP